MQPAHAHALLGEDAVTGGTAGRLLGRRHSPLDLAPDGDRPDDPPVLRVVLPAQIAPPTVVVDDGRAPVRAWPEAGGVLGPVWGG